MKRTSLNDQIKTKGQQNKPHRIGATFYYFHSSLLRMVRCFSLCSQVWDHILKHQFERMVYTTSHFAVLSGILTLAFHPSWTEAYPTSPFLNVQYSIKLCLFRQEKMFLVMAPTSEAVIKNLSFCSAQ